MQLTEFAAKLHGLDCLDCPTVTQALLAMQLRSKQAVAMFQVDLFTSRQVVGEAVAQL
ncbi:hypothetical protein GJV26_28535 [Massilia dura]|uniref:Uncharacterized protein n=1 Tax=Pseudoduganella dura TaxID=321982 RepID=A0A6I3XHQ7_9BURK|nr:hypothetical protein [Pseudoduganella dura]MUI16374.1 hypothetical protein [Pseudoduganella dura]